MRLPCHPNIAPFDRVVIDELEGRVVGFTNVYIPGGSLEQNRSRVFRLSWLQQLIKLVDDLNLQYGIAHQDIAPRNLAVDESKDTIMLFDFNYAARIGHSSSPGDGEAYLEERNDIKGLTFTIYEIITRDDKLRSISHDQQNLDALRQEWVKHPEVKLDNPVATYQRLLQKWQDRRAKIPNIGHPTKAITWPSRPQPPERILTTMDPQGRPSSIIVDGWCESRQEVRDRGGKVLNWQRPPQRILDTGVRVLCTGEVIQC
jgi:hypothetical protein